MLIYFGFPRKYWIINRFRTPGGVVSLTFRELSKKKFAKICTAKNHISGENFTLKLWMWAQSMALGTRTKFQLAVLISRTISAKHKFQGKNLESSRNVIEEKPADVYYPSSKQYSCRYISSHFLIQINGQNTGIYMLLYFIQYVWGLGDIICRYDSIKTYPPMLLLVSVWYNNMATYWSADLFEETQQYISIFSHFSTWRWRG